ncbi:alpha/beta hydrolase [Aquimarina sp. TRL1]|uniref:alpha/beta hydrolase n=1 Tax=Aquimarina sp. (strain TRL1) TaxID=2736252 RepID=UPI001C3772D7|nr:alpha/beta hydrolase [Aquimarina sp. TRL1]
MKYSVLIIKFICFSYISFCTGQEKHNVLNNIDLDKDVKAFLETINSYTGPPIETFPVSKARQSYINLQAGETEHSNCSMTHHQITMPSDQKVDITIVTPKTTIKPLPVLLYFHGGGWILGGLETHERFIKTISEKANTAVVFVHYSLAPEAIYPTALEEGYAALEWIKEHGDSFGLDSQRIAIGGDSAGGNMATVISLLSKERKGPKIDFQLLFYPVTDTRMNTVSYKRFAEKHYLTKSAMEWFLSSYAPDKKLRKKHTVAPLRTKRRKLSQLPPALIITAEYDVLRDEGEAYANKLRKAGVPVISTRYRGTIHDFVILNRLANTAPSKKAIEQATAALLFFYNKKKPLSQQPFCSVHKGSND